MTEGSTHTFGSEESTREVSDVFALFDINNDGVIDSEDLRTALNSLGFEFNTKEINRFISEMDPDHTNSISFTNFSELIHSKMAEREEVDQILTAFNLIDTDKSGKISFKNLKQLARELDESLTDQEIREIISEADADNDGEISLEEFVALVKTASFS